MTSPSATSHPGSVLGDVSQVGTSSWSLSELTLSSFCRGRLSWLDEREWGERLGFAMRSAVDSFEDDLEGRRISTLRYQLEVGAERSGERRERR